MATQAPTNAIKDEFEDNLQMEILNTLNENQVVMTTSTVAAIILEDRSSSFNEEVLLKKAVWLYHEIDARHGHQFIKQAPKAEAIRTALQQLSPFLEQKKGMFEPYVRAQKDYKNILMLSYYRNGLSHIFVNEAFIALTLLALGETVCMEEGVTLTRVQNHAYFIADLLSNEFVVKQKLNSE